MEQWEYLSVFIKADTKNKSVREYLKQQWPDEKPQRYSPKALMPELNKLGAEGWELMHIEPVIQGRKGDILQSGNERWAHVYFCVFKRRKTIPAVMPVDASGRPMHGSGGGD